MNNKSLCSSNDCDDCQNCGYLIDINPEYIFRLHDKSDEFNEKCLIRVAGISEISKNLLARIINSKGYRSFHQAFFSDIAIRHCFRDCSYSTFTLQIRGIHAIPLVTLKRIFTLYSDSVGFNGGLKTRYMRRIIKEGRFVAGPSGVKVKLPLKLSPKLSFLSGLISGD